MKAPTVPTEAVPAKTEFALSRLGRLPAFNQTAVRLLGRPFGDNDSVSDLEVPFRTDPALASQLLVAANSALFGFRSQICTIRHGLALLGIERIRSLVASIATATYMRQFPTELVRPIWSHGIATAVIAEQLVNKLPHLNGPALYTAGLTHDLGRLGLLASTRQEYEKFLFGEYQDRDDSEMREWEQFGVIHTVAGGLLTNLWGFPESLCSHAENHHAVTSFDSEADRVMHNACLIADAMGYPELKLRTSKEPTMKLQDPAGCAALIKQRIDEFLS